MDREKDGGLGGVPAARPEGRVEGPWWNGGGFAGGEVGIVGEAPEGDGGTVMGTYGMGTEWGGTERVEGRDTGGQWAQEPWLEVGA